MTGDAFDKLWPGELCALLPGVAVVLGVLVGQLRLLRALPGQIGHLGGNTASVPFDPETQAAFLNWAQQHKVGCQSLILKILDLDIQELQDDNITYFYLFFRTSLFSNHPSV